MAHIETNGIELDFEETGARNGTPLVLIRGLGTQRIAWPKPLLRGFTDRGLRLITFDNRDAGLSSAIEGGSLSEIQPAVMKALAGETVAAPYSLSDMARDVVGLLDALRLRDAHVLGISMGGMIAQLIAIEHPERVRSLVSIMSSSGAPDLPPPTPEALGALLSQPEDPSDRSSVVENAVRIQETIGSPGFRTDRSTLQASAEAAYDRSHRPVGVAQQLLAVLTSRDRADRLASIRVPTLVIHGEDDPLVHLECGRDTANRIPNSVFRRIPGMGHDLAPGLCETLVEAVASHVEAAELASA